LVAALGREQFLCRFEIRSADEDLARAGVSEDACQALCRDPPVALDAGAAEQTADELRLVLVADRRQRNRVVQAHSCIMPVQPALGWVDGTGCTPASAKRANAASPCGVKSTAPGTTTGEVQSSSR